MPECEFRDVPRFQMEKFTPDDVKTIILSLKNNTSSGYDNMPAVFLIKCVDILCVPLATIFDMSIEGGKYPDLLKRNNVIPIFKRKGDKQI